MKNPTTWILISCRGLFFIFFFKRLFQHIRLEINVSYRMILIVLFIRWRGGGRNSGFVEKRCVFHKRRPGVLCWFFMSVVWRGTGRGVCVCGGGQLYDVFCIVCRDILDKSVAGMKDSRGGGGLQGSLSPSCSGVKFNKWLLGSNTTRCRLCSHC